MKCERMLILGHLLMNIFCMKIKIISLLRVFHGIRFYLKRSCRDDNSVLLFNNVYQNLIKIY